MREYEYAFFRQGYISLQSNSTVTVPLSSGKVFVTNRVHSSPSFRCDYSFGDFLKDYESDYEQD